MSLRRQLFIVLSALLMAIFIVSLWASLFQTRRHLEQQLATHTQDAASTLATALITPLEKKDLVQVESQVSRVFDRGLYQRIDVLGADGQPVISKNLPDKTESVPGWFSFLLNVQAVQVEAPLVAEKPELGKVQITSQANPTQKRLWRAATDLWLMFGGIYVAALMGLQALLRRFLQPLGWIEQCARAIQQKRFEQITDLPRAPELARVAMAMNDMSRRVAEMLDEGTKRAEALRRKAYEDDLTGLSNHRGFELQLNQLLNDDCRFELAGVLLLELDGMQAFYRDRSFIQATPFLKSVAQLAKESFEQKTQSLLARNSESAFSFVVTKLNEEGITGLAESFRKKLEALIEQSPAKEYVSFSLGLTFFYQDDKPSEFLARADLALETARHQGRNGLHALPHQHDEVSTLGSFGWRNLIKNALEENRWQLVAQPVVDLEEKQTFQEELMARLVDRKGQLVPANQFLPMATRHKLMSDIDLALVTLAFKRLRSEDEDSNIAINLSHQSIANNEFVDFLETKLAELKADAHRLSLELSEYGCLSDLEAAQSIKEMAHEHGAKFGIDNFGLDPQALQLLRQIPPDYVKLNGGLVEALPKDLTAQIMVEAIVDLAHSLEVQVIAQNVEQEDQVRALKNVSIDGGQGYLFGAPA